MFYLGLILLSIINTDLLSYWLILEISLILVLPFILNNKFGFELGIKYFLVQVLGSFLLLYFFIIGFKRVVGFISILRFKIGIAPFYRWALFISCKSDWNRIFLLLGVLKFIPFILVVTLSREDLRMSLLIAVNRVLRGVGGLGCVCLRRLIVYSSLGQNAWILACAFIKDLLWLEYYRVYISILVCTIFGLSSLFLYHIKDLGELRTRGVFLVVIILSLRGLPPFTVFFLKVFVISFLIQTYPPLAFLLLASSLLRLGYYLRVSVEAYVLKRDWKAWVASSAPPRWFLLFLTVNFFIVYHCFI